MLNDGVVDGQPLLPEGWIEYMTTPSAQSGGYYGAQTWLNPDDPDPEKLLPEELSGLNVKDGVIDNFLYAFKTILLLSPVILDICLTDRPSCFSLSR